MTSAQISGSGPLPQPMHPQRAPEVKDTVTVRLTDTLLMIDQCHALALTITEAIVGPSSTGAPAPQPPVNVPVGIAGLTLALNTEVQRLRAKLEDIRSALA